MRLYEAQLMLCLIGGGWMICKLCRHYKLFDMLKLK